MSERLTSDFTENNEGAFGPKGKMGDIGEQNVLMLLDDLRIIYRHNPSDKVKQIAGLDIEIFENGSWVGIDVKANIHSDDKENVCIDYEKLKISKAKYWFHINNDDPLTDWIVYPVKSMLEIAKAYTAVGKDGVRWVPKEVAKSLQ